jgi:hypothetical protein
MFSIKNPASVLGRYAGLGVDDTGVDVTPPSNLPRPWTTDGCKEFLNQKIDGRCNMAPLASSDEIIPDDPVKRAVLRRVLFNAVDFGVGNVGTLQQRRTAANAQYCAGLSDDELQAEFKKYMKIVFRLKNIAESYEKKWEIGAVTGDPGLENWAAKQIARTRELAAIYASNALLARRVQLLRQGRDFDTDQGGFQGLGLIPVAMLVGWGFSTLAATVISWTGVAVVVAAAGTGVYYMGATSMSDYHERTDPNLQTAAKIEDAIEKERDCVVEQKKFLKTQNPQITDRDAYLEATRKCNEVYAPQLDWDSQLQATKERESLLGAFTDIGILVGVAAVGYAAMPIVKGFFEDKAADRRRSRDEGVASA